VTRDDRKRGIPEPRDGLDALFRPRSVAVLGASPRPGSIGREVIRNLVAGEYRGKVFPVNPAHDVVMSMKCYPAVQDVPDPIDLAVVIVPKDMALDTIQQCGELGVRSLVIVSAGFGETGRPDGLMREQVLREMLARYGMRAAGPNCMGLINTAPEIHMNASFSRLTPAAGPISFVSQSGALGEAMLELAAERGTGISMFCSIGNRVDVDAVDLVTYWGADPRTKVIAMYVESFLDPRRFIPVARRVAREKPIVAVKAGRTAAGARAALSHTGSLVGRDVSYDALFEECGIIRVGSVTELFDVATALAEQPAAPGRRVAVVTNAGGPGILATDALCGLGLTIGPLSDATVATLRAALSPEASVGNPVDALAAAAAADYDAAIRAVLADPAVDGLMVIFVPPIMTDAEAVAKAIATACREANAGKPVVTCFMMRSHSESAPERALREAGIPTYLFPERAAKALAALVDHGQARARPADTIPDLPVDRARGQAIVAAARTRLGSDGGILGLEEAMGLVSAYGIPVPRTAFAHTLEETLEAAATIGYPVVAKVDSPAIAHRTDVKGVETGIADEGDLVRAWRRLSEILRDHGGNEGRIAIQQALAGCRETIIGMSADPVFGPLIMFGLGGIHVEVIRDVVFRLHPVGERHAHEMVRQVRGFSILAGTRGEPPVDLDLLALCLVRLSLLVSDHPGVSEIEINPLLVAPPGMPSAAVDVRVRLG
jgi:acetyltransferase